MAWRWRAAAGRGRVLRARPRRRQCPDIAANPRSVGDVRAAGCSHGRVLVERLARFPAHHTMDGPDRHWARRHRRGCSHDRGPGHRRAIGPRGCFRSQPRSWYSDDVSRHAGAGRCGVHRHVAVVSRLRAVATGRTRAAALGPRRPRALLRGGDRCLLPVRQPQRRACRRARGSGTAQPGRPDPGSGLRLRPRGRGSLADGVLHCAARLASQHNRPARRSPPGRQRAGDWPRCPELPSAPRPGALAAGCDQCRLRLRHQRGPHRRHALRGLASHAASRRPGPHPHARPDSSGGHRAQPGARRLRGQRALDKSHS